MVEMVVGYEYCMNFIETKADSCELRFQSAYANSGIYEYSSFTVSQIIAVSRTAAGKTLKSYTFSVHLHNI